MTTMAVADIIPILVIALAVLVACDTQVARRAEEPRQGAPAGRALEDATITSQVKSRLTLDGTPGLDEIGVQTDRGVVRLEGIVASDDAKHRATQLAREVAGVRDVVNNLRVQG